MQAPVWPKVIMCSPINPYLQNRDALEISFVVNIPDALEKKTDKAEANKKGYA
jgi:hypothetical protein